MYRNKSEKGGRPNCDVLMMFRILILEEWYGLSDLEVVRQITDRVSFMGFLVFPEHVPDSGTVWLFKERMIETGTYDRVWDEFRDQLDFKGLKVKRGTIQDATFIESDPGPSKKPRGDQAKTRRSRDGTWTGKGEEFHFGYKLHYKMDIYYALIREIETTTAKVHDKPKNLSFASSRTRESLSSREPIKESTVLASPISPSASTAFFRTSRFSPLRS